MTDHQFWALIEAALEASNGKHEAKLEHLQQNLERLEPEDILGFQRNFNRLHKLSHRADLWGAAFLMNGGASDDGFDYFRGWLIAQGRKVFEAALENPDSLAEVVEDDTEADFGFENEDILYLAMQVWKAKTGLESEAFYEQLVPTAKKDVEFGDLETWSKDGDADEEKCKAIYPKLWERFGWEA